MNQLLKESSDVLEATQKPENVAQLTVQGYVQVVYTFEIMLISIKVDFWDLLKRSFFLNFFVELSSIKYSLSDLKLFVKAMLPKTALTSLTPPSPTSTSQ